MASVGTIKYKNGSSWIDILHPVNSFYISYASTSPASLFGGTWTQITNAVISGAEENGYVGSDTHTLTTLEIPAHRHIKSAYWGVICSQGMNTGNLNATYNDTGTGVLRYGANVVDWVGGALHIQSCNAPSTVTSGIALRKSKRVM